MTQQEFAAPRFTGIEVASIMSGLMLAMFLASLDQTIVATSLSSIARDLQGWDNMAWVVSAYLVTSTVTTPIYGRLSDLYGRRLLMLISIGLFVATSILCALAPTMPLLIAGRALQGLGGGGLRAVSQAVISDIAAPRERARYQAYFSSVFAVSNVLGPVLGGVFAQDLSWHWIFWINLPLGLAAFILCNRGLIRLAVPTRRPVIDWLGAVLILAATTPILIGIANAERAGGWMTVRTIGPVLIGLVCFGLLILRERAAPEPMLPLHLFGNGIFAVGNLITFLISIEMVGLVVLVPLNYELAAGLTARDAGFHLIPMTMGTVIASFVAGQLVSRLGRYRIFPIVGTVSGAVACAAIAAVGLGHSAAFDIAVTAIVGMSFGCQMAPMTVAMQNALHWQDAGVGLSVLMFCRLIGGAFGVALLSTVLIGALTAGALAVPGHEMLGPEPGFALFHLDDPGTHLTPALLSALDATIRQSFARVYWIAAAILGVAAVAAFCLREIPLRGRALGS